MSKYEMIFIEYFKIRWARRPLWSLEQAAYLSCGQNPDLKNHRIAPNEENLVSHRFYWLQNKFKKGHLHVLGHADETELFEWGAIVRLLREKKTPVDDNMQFALDHMHNAHLPNDFTGGIVTRTVFREAGRMVFELYPKAIISDVALAIEALPTYFNKRGFGYIDSYSFDSLSSHNVGFD